MKIDLCPTVVFLDVQGEDNFHFAGYMHEFHIESASDCVTSGAYGREPQFQRFAQARTDKLREQGKPVDLRRWVFARVSDRCVPACV